MRCCPAEVPGADALAASATLAKSLPSALAIFAKDNGETIATRTIRSYLPEASAARELEVWALSGKIVLIWTVLGPAVGKIRAGILAQRYVKATNAPGHAPVLVGETNSGIAVQFETNDSAAPTRQLLKWSCSLLEPLLDEEVATERTLSAMDSA